MGNPDAWSWGLSLRGKVETTSIGNLNQNPSNKGSTELKIFKRSKSPADLTGAHESSWKGGKKRDTGGLPGQVHRRDIHSK